jgi:hypothetical protein
VVLLKNNRNKKYFIFKSLFNIPIGNIKANETANVQGRIRSAGCIPDERA